MKTLVVLPLFFFLFLLISTNLASASYFVSKQTIDGEFSTNGSQSLLNYQYTGGLCFPGLSWSSSTSGWTGVIGMTSNCSAGTTHTFWFDYLYVQNWTSPNGTFVASMDIMITNITNLFNGNTPVFYVYDVTDAITVASTPLKNILNKQSVYVTGNAIQYHEYLIEINFGTWTLPTTSITILWDNIRFGAMEGAADVIENPKDCVFNSGQKYWWPYFNDSTTPSLFISNGTFNSFIYTDNINAPYNWLDWSFSSLFQGEVFVATTPSGSTYSLPNCLPSVCDSSYLSTSKGTKDLTSGEGFSYPFASEDFPGAITNHINDWTDIGTIYAWSGYNNLNSYAICSGGVCSWSGTLWRISTGQMVHITTKSGNNYSFTNAQSAVGTVCVNDTTRRMYKTTFPGCNNNTIIYGNCTAGSVCTAYTTTPGSPYNTIKCMNVTDGTTVNIVNSTGDSLVNSTGIPILPSQSGELNINPFGWIALQFGGLFGMGSTENLTVVEAMLSVFLSIVTGISAMLLVGKEHKSSVFAVGFFAILTVFTIGLSNVILYAVYVILLILTAGIMGGFFSKMFGGGG